MMFKNAKWTDREKWLADLLKQLLVPIILTIGAAVLGLFYYQDSNPSDTIELKPDNAEIATTDTFPIIDATPRMVNIFKLSEQDNEKSYVCDGPTLIRAITETGIPVRREVERGRKVKIVRSNQTKNDTFHIGTSWSEKVPKFGGLRHVTVYKNQIIRGGEDQLFKGDSIQIACPF